MRDIDRRAVLKGMLGGAALLGAGVARGPTARAAEAAAGGRVRFAALGAATDTFNPLRTSSHGEYTALFHIYDSLAFLQGGRIELSLAEALEPNADATVWTVRLRPGVTFHDGRPMTAADVVASVRLLADPAESPNNSSFFADIDLVGLRQLDDLTAEIPLHRPRGDLVESRLSQISLMFPEKPDFAKGIGSGPFTLAAFEPGRSARLARYPDYWGGAALLEELEYLPISDPAARLAALKGGEIEYAVGVTPSAVATERGNDRIVINRGGAANSTALMFTMNVTKPPFTDPRVREAFRLAIDRQALIDTVLFGEGAIGNDLVGKGQPGYDEDIPQRERDVDQARSLLAAAGVDEVTLRVADIVPGVVAAGELYAQQLGEAGVHVRLDKADADSYFSDYAAVLATPFQGFYFVNRPPAVHIGSYTGSASSFNPTGYGNPDYDARLTRVQATVDDAARAEQYRELQRILHDDGGEIVWGFQEELDAAVPGLVGVEFGQSLPRFHHASFA